MIFTNPQLRLPVARGMMAIELACAGPRALLAPLFVASEDPASPHFCDRARARFAKVRLRKVPFEETTIREEAVILPADRG